ncbi:hypothetical protein PG995_008221 [Apiospora arundinis]
MLVASEVARLFCGSPSTRPISPLAFREPLPPRIASAVPMLVLVLRVLRGGGGGAAMTPSFSRLTFLLLLSRELILGGLLALDCRAGGGGGGDNFGTPSLLVVTVAIEDE